MSSRGTPDPSISGTVKPRKFSFYYVMHGPLAAAAAPTRRRPAAGGRGPANGLLAAAYVLLVKHDLIGAAHQRSA